MKKHKQEQGDLQAYLGEVEQRQHNVLLEDQIRNGFSVYQRLLDGYQEITTLQLIGFIIFGLAALSGFVAVYVLCESFFRR